MTMTIDDKLEIMITQDEVVEFLLYARRNHNIAFTLILNAYFSHRKQLKESPLEDDSS